MPKSKEQILKKAIGVLAALFLLSVAYYGSYLPLAKSMLFISTMQQASNAKTLQEFEQLFSAPLDAHSPIGQEELVRNTASTILGTLQSVSDPRVITELNRFIFSYYDPILSRGHGMSFGQDLYIAGAINEISFVKTQDPTYLKDAQKYYSESVDFAPDRPQGLYGLFDIYRMEGDISQVQSIGERILMLWPTDDHTRSSLADFLAQASSTAHVAK